MRTLLDMVQELWRESGSGGPEPQTIETTNGGEVERLLGWIIRADHEVQSLHTDWQFMWRNSLVLTVAGTAIYQAPIGLRQYDEVSFLLDDQRLPVVDYLYVRGEYIDPLPNRPYRAVRMPNRSLRLDSIPDQEYRLSYDWYVQPTRIDRTLGNGATSIIPSEYLAIVIARALMHYANYENAPELMPTATDMYNTWKMALEADQLPGKREAHMQAEGNLDMDIFIA